MSPDTLERIYKLNTGVVGRGENRHERPHKPAMLLAVLDLVAMGEAKQERIEWSRKLRERFAAYFAIVGTPIDKCTPENPFYHLNREGFWKPFRVDDGGTVTELQAPPLVSDADTGRVFARVEAGFANLDNPVERELVRRRIVSRYFPNYSAALSRQFQDGPLPVSLKVAEEPPEEEVVRSAAFRRTVVDVYDFQCAACGLRIRLQPNDLSFVDAAHLIPFSESHNDHPTNGIALCKNHHWAMDKRLIAPGPEMIWHVSSFLDRRRSPGEAELVQLAGQPVLPPREVGYRPQKEALEWRVERLRA